MKRYLTIAAMLISAVQLCAAEALYARFGSVKILTSLEAAPQIVRVSGGGFYASGGGNPVNSRWLAIRVEFTPGGVSSNASNKADQVGTVRRIPGRWMDDVTLKLSVAVPIDGINTRSVTYGILEGKTLFWSIPLDGKRHTAQMFVPPQLLDRYIAARNTSGSNVARLNHSEFQIEAVFVDRDGNVLGKGYSNMASSGGLKDGAFFAAWRNRAGAVVVPGAVIPRSRTPWAWHQPSSFDWIKDAPEDTPVSAEK